MSSFRTGNPRFRPTFPWPFRKNTPPPLQTETRPPGKEQKRQDVAPVFVVPFVGCALTKAQHPRHGEFFRRKRSEPPSHQENPPRTRKHPFLCQPNATAIQTVIKKRKLFLFTSTLALAVVSCRVSALWPLVQATQS